MKRSGQLFLAVLLFLTLAASAQAAVYTPTKTADTADGACTALDCSLREAVIAANQNPGSDVILLHAGTYSLTIPGNNEDLAATGDLDIQADLILLGDGAASTVISGGAIDRVFQVTAGVTSEIRDVTITNGRAPGLGGAILNAGDLTVERSILSGNVSAAGTAGAGFGGALYTDGLDSRLTVSSSTIHSNTAQGGGGGLAAGGTVSLANVTISGNRSQEDFGGGLYVFSDARVTANNITVVSNQAALRGGGLLAENSAFIGVSPRITNSIIAANTASSEPDCSGPVDSSYNLIGVGAGCVGPSAANHDLVGTAGSPLDPKVGALQVVGGPTPTRPLATGSPAINNGNPDAPGSGGGACEATDQRGVARPGAQGSGTPRCDIGAYEVTTACVAGGPVLCLSNGRFQLTAKWQTANGNNDSAQGVTLTGDSGYFWFFDPANVELTVKVLDACGVNNRKWVFLSGLTNVKVDLTVTDTKTGTVKTYSNPQGRVFRTILDTNAFATCP